MNRDALRRSLHVGEGCRLSVYDDATGEPLRPGYTLVGHATIGWGLHVCCSHGLTQDEADEILEHRIDAVVIGMVDALPWVQTLDDVRFGVLAEVAYQCGVSGLLGFCRMLAAAQTGDWPAAAAELLHSEVAAKHGSRYARLARRLESGVQ